MGRNSFLKIVLGSLVSIVFLVFFFFALRGYFAVPNAITVFGIRLSMYGLIAGIAILSLVSLIESHIRREFKEHVAPSLPWIIIPAIVLARAWHVATDFNLYQDNLIGSFQIWNGGLSIFGALIGACIGAIVYLKKVNLPVWENIELAFLFAPVAQIIGRFGNFVNQELYGFPTDLSWGVFIRPENRHKGFESYEFFHPTFLYEMIGNAFLFAIMYYLFRKRGIKGDGKFIAIYLVGYGIVRTIVNLFRIDPQMVFSVSLATSLGMVVVGAVLIVVQKLKFKIQKLS